MPAGLKRQNDEDDDDMNERMNGLLAYLDRLIALEGVGFMSKREVTECIKAIREELALGTEVKANIHAGEFVVTSEADIDSIASQLAKRLEDDARA